MRNFEENYSLVRALHAMPNGDEVDVYINGFPFYSGIRFAQFTPYIYVPKGEYIFSVYPKDEKDNPITESKITVNSEELITMPIVEIKEGAKLLPIAEEISVPCGNNSKFKFVHLSPDAPRINILIENDRVFENVEYQDYTEYEQIDSDEYKMDIEISENNKIVLSNKVKVNPGKIYTFYAIGNAPNIEIIQTLDGATFLN
ncbi:MAG: DUF4397 domain-containing protein [Romboutsia sp.]